MSRFRLFGALLLASSAALGACTIVDGSEDSSSELTDPSTQTCLRDTIEVCYGQELTPEACAALIEANCLGGGPGPGDPDDPGCVDQVFQDCLASGVDEMTCWALANDQCNPGPGDPPCDPPPECDPATGMDCPPPDCDPMTDPNCWPPPPPDCDPMTDPNCWPPPPPDCDPMTDPNCWPPPPPDCDPMTDPNCWPPPPPDCGPNGMDCPPPPDCGPNGMECPPEPPPCNDPGCGMP